MATQIFSLHLYLMMSLHTMVLGNSIDDVTVEKSFDYLSSKNLKHMTETQNYDLNKERNDYLNSVKIKPECEKADEHEPIIWDHDVYTGRHFNAIVLPSTRTDNIVEKPAVLVLYGPKCNGEAMDLRESLNDTNLVNTYVTVTFHDYVIFPSHVWYDLDEVDDLYRRYNKGGHCLQVFLFVNGSSLSDPEPWTGTGDPVDWLKSKITVDITVVNKLSHDITVKMEDDVESDTLNTVSAGESSVVKVQVGYMLTFCLPDETILHYVLIEPQFHSTMIEVTQEKVEEFKKVNGTSFEWMESEYDDLQERSDTVYERQHGIAKAYLHAFTQAVLLPRHTTEGYRKMAIPSTVYKPLLHFYKKSLVSSENETVPEQEEALFNTDQVQTTMVPLTHRVQSLVQDQLLKSMGEWCKCRLNQTFFHGIREYHKGSILHSHVDQPGIQVFTAMLLIHQDLNGTAPWALEVTGFKGQHQKVMLEPGEMLLYESATLMHGRPRPFEGDFYAVCYVHYQPSEGWTWGFGEDTSVTDDVNTWNYAAINTAHTLRSQTPDRVRDEL